jgi:diguanylate cyclase (GGDEF)-like protein
VVEPVEEPLSAITSGAVSAFGVPGCAVGVAEVHQRLQEAQHEGIKLSVLLIDVDGLKLTNDTLGHHEGDRLLTTVADTLSSELRGPDIPARLGGDEFVILLPHTGSIEASAIARRLACSINGAAQAITCLRGVGASVGWAEFGVDGRDADELLIAADRSMYAAKRHSHQRARRPARG